MFMWRGPRNGCRGICCSAGRCRPTLAAAAVTWRALPVDNGCLARCALAGRLAAGGGVEGASDCSRTARYSIRAWLLLCVSGVM